MMSFFKQSQLVRHAEREFIDMLDLGYNMFSLATKPISQNEPSEFVDDFNALDKKINKKHRDVRKKLFEHLSLSGGRDLFPSLVLLSVVDDSERIGDYTKNIAEILAQVSQFNIDDYQEDFMAILNNTNERFLQTKQAFIKEDEELAESLVQNYKNQAQQCNALLVSLLTTADNVKRDYVALALMVRYLKRISAHLKNIASAVVNPYHRIGYKVKK
jgi:phosphate uptake regulator